MDVIDLLCNTSLLALIDWLCFKKDSKAGSIVWCSVWDMQCKNLNNHLTMSLDYLALLLIL